MSKSVSGIEGKIKRLQSDRLLKAADYSSTAIDKSHTGLTCMDEKMMASTEASYKPRQHRLLVDSTVVDELMSRQADDIRDYFRDVDSLQPRLKPKMRVILLDWMSQVCQDTGMMRDTFHYAVGLLDRFLSAYRLQDTKYLQLVGLVCVSIASKLEEVASVTVGQLLVFCLNLYDVHDYEKFELVVLKSVGWRVRSVTLNSWVCAITTEWDRFVGSVGLTAAGCKHQDLLTRAKTSRSFELYQGICQVCECLMMDLKYTVYRQHLLAAAVVYSLLHRHAEAGKRVDMRRLTDATTGLH